MMERSFDFGVLLQNHQKNHKIRPTQFVSVESGIQKRLETNIKTRKSARLTVFDSIRNLQRCDIPKKPDPQTKLEHRKMQLEKWKEEKEKKKKQAAAMKKKPFITGIAHAPLKYEPPPPPPRTLPSMTGRVTRSQTSKTNTKIQQNNSVKTSSKQQKTQSFAPRNASFKPPELKTLIKLPTLAPQPKEKKNTKTFEFNPVLTCTTKVNHKTVKSKTQSNHKLDSKSRTMFDSKNNDSKMQPMQVVKRPTRGKYVKAPSSSQSQSSSEEMSVSKELLPKARTPRKSIQAAKMSTPKNPIPKSESSSEERLKSPKSPVNVPMTPEQIAEEAKKISPCVTLSRGKDNARKEMKMKMKEGLLQEDASDMDSVDYFSRQMDSEIKRMTEMCDTWEKISEQVVLPEAVQEAVLGAVGQARLLMSQKMQQFASLVSRCERPEPGHSLVTPADLHGFWDMVFMQVENVDMRFKKLEEMRARNWVEESPVVQRKRVVPRAKPAAKPAATSRIRDMIAAARKAKQQNSKASESPQESLESSKTFEAGFFCVRSPVRQAAPSTPSHRPSLLKAVLSSEANKSASKSQNSASLAMLRASLIGKNIENEDVLAEPLPLTPINLTATPGRSILKPQNIESTKKSSKKSIKMVLFNESDAENDASLIEGMSEINMDAKKENKGKRHSLVRQDAIEDRSPVMTRSRRKSMSSPLVDPKGDEITPRRSSLRKRQGAEK